MTEITENLMKEHENILFIIDKLLKECNELEKGKSINKDFFNKIIDFIKNYADKFHHMKEEDILFKEICNNESKMHCNPVNVMLHEHEIGRNHVKEMIKALQENNKRNLIENAKGYCYLLQEHIHKEDNILYPMAEEAMDDKTKEKIIKKYKEIENKKKKDKIKYLNFVEKLKDNL